MNFSNIKDIEKQYYLVPLRLTSVETSDTMVYEIDKKLILKVEKLHKEGFKAV